MSGFSFFVLLVFAIILILLAIVAYDVSLFRHGGWSRLVNYFKHGAGKGALTGAGAVVMTALVVAALVFFRHANASPLDQYPNIELGGPAYFRAGIDISSRDPSAQCVDSDGFGDRVSGIVEVTQRLVRLDNVTGNLFYQHRSCAINRDRNSHDAIGLDVRIRLW